MNYRLIRIVVAALALSASPAGAAEPTVEAQVAEPEPAGEDEAKLQREAHEWVEQTRELGAAAWESGKEAGGAAWDKAKEVGGEIAERSGEYYEVAKEQAKEAYEQTQNGIEASQEPPPSEPAE
jgi:hypothetical protein